MRVAVLGGSGPRPTDLARQKGIQSSVALLEAAISEIELISGHEEVAVSSATSAPRAEATRGLSTTEATVTANKIEIVIHDDIYVHIEQYLQIGNYYHAVEEAYKVVREKLKELSGKERATEVFNDNAQSDKYYNKLFGTDKPKDEAERDFFKGIGYIHLGVQFLRNEKVHTPARPIDRNLALHYIALASLAYDLISQYVSDEVIQEVEQFIKTKRLSYHTASSFYADFENGCWLRDLTIPDSLKSRTVRKVLKDKWLQELDFTSSYDHSNIMAMRLELISHELTPEDIEGLLDQPTEDRNGRSQEAGMILEFMRFMAQRHPERLSHKVQAWIATKQ